MHTKKKEKKDVLLVIWMNEMSDARLYSTS